MSRPVLIDGFGRPITYLRLSVTDRCDFRCVYCMSELTRFVPKPEVLTLEELARLAKVFLALGIRKIRLTGGEPLLRRNLLSLVRSLGEQVAAGHLEELTLTTNGSQLASFAEQLAACGIRRINVSLDSLDPDSYQHITRGGRLAPVLEGIRAALAAGLAIKLNCVVMKGVNEDDPGRLIRWCGETGCDLTLIEVMPLGVAQCAGETGNPGRPQLWLSLDEMRLRLEREWTLEESEAVTAGPSRYVRVRETGRKLGFITPLSRSFCEGCNRLRLTCNGMLHPCLGRNVTLPLAGVLRNASSDAELEAAIRNAVAAKPDQHGFLPASPAASDPIVRGMHATGG